MFSRTNWLPDEDEVMTSSLLVGDGCRTDDDDVDDVDDVVVLRHQLDIYHDDKYVTSSPSPHSPQQGASSSSGFGNLSTFPFFPSFS